MDEFATTDIAQAADVPEALRALFNDPDHVKVQRPPSEIPDLASRAGYFAAGTRTMPHRHERGQHIVVTEGVGVVADESVTRVVRAGDVISSPSGGWHWHGATSTTAMTHVTMEHPGLDLDVEQRNWDEAYTDDLGA
ncbi:MAG: cupin domain-containing protein [Pseudonocardiales bacterium]